MPKYYLVLSQQQYDKFKDDGILNTIASNVEVVIDQLIETDTTNHSKYGKQVGTGITGAKLFKQV